jgi:methylated-DNA-[protein]-cysteine S-methyltransferase
MRTRGFSLFDTALGRCGIAWDERGIVSVQLPEPDDAATRARLLRRAVGAEEKAPPPDVQRVVDGIAALMLGHPVDFASVELNMDGVPEFHRRVYEAASAVPAGRMVTYGDIAKQLGDPGAAQAVGQALGANPFPVIVPCHRVVAAGGKTGGFSAPGGARTKLRMLAIERAKLGDAPDLFD